MRLVGLGSGVGADDRAAVVDVEGSVMAPGAASKLV